MSRPPRRWTASPRATTRVAFTVIVVFVVAQAVWWIVFQRDYIADVTTRTTQAWAAEAVTAQEAVDAVAAAGAEPATVQALVEATLARHPQLTFDEGRFAVDAATLEAFVSEQRGFLNMFAFEGPFFVLVILTMLLLIGRSLREERELKRSHQNFLSAVTHEFKTPVATLRLLIETAQMRELDEAKRDDYLARMAGEVDRLERTSEQVLAAARLEQAPEAPVLEPRDLRDAVAGVVRQMRPGLEARGARVTVEAAEVPLAVSIDDHAFALVLSNLLDNAVKYAPEGRREIVVRLEGTSDLAMLHVDDAGVGIDETERERIFQRFHRSGDESTRRAPGTGLGLYLVRSTVEAMNGWIRADANPSGVGSRFTVVLPRRVGATVATSALSGGSVT